MRNKTLICTAFLTFPILSFAGESYIHTFGGGELLAKVFHALSMLIYGNQETGIGKTFGAIVKIALAVGGFSAICMAFFREKFEPLIKSFFLPAVGITSLLLVPRSTIYIYDHLAAKTKSTQAETLKTVDNVPFFLAKFASLVSTLSYHFTQGLEKVTHGPNQAVYNWTGHIYAGENLFQAGKLHIANRTLENNFREFCRECTWRDVGIGLYSKDDLVHAKDLLKFLEENTSKLRTVLYRNPSQGIEQSTFLPCHDAIKKIREECNKKEGNTKKLLFGEMGSEIGFLLNQGKIGEKELKDLIKQQIAIDTLKEELPGTLKSFAVKRAEIFQRENQKILGALGARSIVSMRNFFEAVIYMVFPLIVIFALIAFGIKAILSWMQFVLWVNMWPPFYVIVNFLLDSIWTYRKKLLFGGPIHLTIFTSDGLVDLYSSMESIAAIALAFVPFLSWILMRGGVSQMVHLASSLMSPAQTAASTAASEKTTGSYSFGNISMGNRSGYNADMFRQSYSGHFSKGTTTIDEGVQVTSFVPGQDRAFVRQSDTYLREGISKTNAFNYSLQDHLSSADAFLQESSHIASSSLNDSTHKAVGFVEALSQSTQLGKSTSSQQVTSAQKTFQDIATSVDEYSKTFGVTREDAVREMIELGANTGFAGTLFGIKGGMQNTIQDGVTKIDTDALSNKESHAKSFMDLLQKSSNLSKTDTANLLNVEDHRKHEDFIQSWNQTLSSLDQLRSAHSKQQTLSSLESSIKSDNISFHQNLNQRFVDYLREELHGDIGQVSEVLEMPSNAPAKEKFIKAFVGEYLPKQLEKTMLENKEVIGSIDKSKYNEILTPSKEELPMKPFDYETRVLEIKNSAFKHFPSETFDFEKREKDFKQTATTREAQVKGSLEKTLSRHVFERITSPHLKTGGWLLDTMSSIKDRLTATNHKTPKTKKPPSHTLNKFDLSTPIHWAWYEGFPYHPDEGS